MNNETKFAQRVNNLLDELKISQKQLAKLSGISESSISRYLAGEMKPRIDIVVNIAKALKVPTTYLTGEIKLNVTNSPFEDTYQIVARNKKQLNDNEKTQIIKLLLGD